MRPLPRERPHRRRRSRRPRSPTLRAWGLFASCWPTTTSWCAKAVAKLLAEVDDLELVDSVGDPQSLLAAVAEHKPDAVLTDIRMPPTHTTEGIDAAKQIRTDHPDIGVVVLSQYVEEDYAFELLADGVAGLGYLLKERVSDIDELVRALQDVARGGSALDPKVVEGLMARKAAEASSPLRGLTDKERAGARADGDGPQRTPPSRGRST